MAAKKYFESRVRLSKGTSLAEQKKKREVARRTKVSPVTLIINYYYSSTLIIMNIHYSLCIIHVSFHALENEPSPFLFFSTTIMSIFKKLLKYF